MRSYLTRVFLIHISVFSGCGSCYFRGLECHRTELLRYWRVSHIPH